MRGPAPVMDRPQIVGWLLAVAISAVLWFVLAAAAVAVTS